VRWSYDSPINCVSSVSLHAKHNVLASGLTQDWIGVMSHSINLNANNCKSNRFMKR
jgi:hypothetical protein